MFLRKTLLEEELFRNETHAKKMIAEARVSQEPENYIPILAGIQKEVDAILEELKKYN